MPKIMKDEHGLYVRAGGYLFRPEPTAHSLTHPLSVGMGSGPYFKNPHTLFAAGDEVKAKHVGGTAAGKVSTDARVEYWHGHGVYLTTGGNRPSNSIWNPL